MSFSIRLIYNLCYFIEFEDADLKKSLREINDLGWHFDKQSPHLNRCLKEDDLVPLMDYTSKKGDNPYFKTVNKYLLELIKTEPILELIKVDIEEPHSHTQPASVESSESESLVEKIIKTANTPQVS